MSLCHVAQYNELDKINDKYAEEIGEGNENKREEGNALDIGSISVKGQSVHEGTLEQGRQRHKVYQILFYVCVEQCYKCLLLYSQ